MANDKSKTKAQLIAELEEMRQQRSIDEACERIREEVLLMRSGDDLMKVNAVLYHEMIRLGVETKACGIYFIDEREDRWMGYTAFENPRLHGISWTSSDLRELDSGIVVGTWEHSVSTAPEQLEAWRQGQAWSQPRNPESAREIGQLVKEQYGLSRVLPFHAPELGMFDTQVSFQYGIIWMLSPEASEAYVSIAQGFAAPLSLAYTRYLDLQAAEERNRQLALERAVERVRAEAMTMRSSDDLLKVVVAIFQEMFYLGIEIRGCNILFVDEKANQTMNYYAQVNPKKFGISWTSPEFVEFNEEVAARMIISSLSETTRIDKDALRNWHEEKVWSYKSIHTEETLKDRIESMGGDHLSPSYLQKYSGEWIVTNVPFKYGYVGFSVREYREEHVTIVQDLTKALSLGYLRFLDFQKVDEAQRQLIDELEEELQTAHDLQMRLMPTEPPRVSGFDISGRCLPANHVGGDFFQYFPISDNRLAISLADVTGHAMEAAIPVVMFSGILDTQMEAGDTLEVLFPQLNRSLCRNLADSRTYICFTMGELDSSTRSFRLSNGGCPYPYHYKASLNEITELQLEAYPLGIRPDTQYPVKELQLGNGDRIIFCSDGIIEAENSSGELFGFERTAETIKKGCEENLSAPNSSTT